MYAVDLHAHTRFFHGRRQLGDRFDPYGVRALAWTARLRGLDGVAMTNHDYYTPLPGRAVTLIPGIEISTTAGHLLVVGPDPPRETEPGRWTPSEAVSLAHERGCVAIVAHPFRNSSLVESDVAFDAVEINGKHPRTAEAVREFASDRELPVVGGSDAHVPFEVGRAYTLVDAPALTPKAVVEAIRDGRVRARVKRGPVDQLLRGAYRRVHEYKYGDDPLGRAVEQWHIRRQPDDPHPP